MAFSTARGDLGLLVKLPCTPGSSAFADPGSRSTFRGHRRSWVSGSGCGKHTNTSRCQSRDLGRFCDLEMQIWEADFVHHWWGFRWVVISEGRYDSVPRHCFVLQLSSWSFVAQLLQRVVSAMFCMPKVCLLNQGSCLPQVSHEENCLPEIKWLTLQPSWYEQSWLPETGSLKSLKNLVFLCNGYYWLKSCCLLSPLHCLPVYMGPVGLKSIQRC